jgi:hypothetical protein
MPKYQAPTSDENRLNNLETARDTATKDIAAGRKSITQETLDAITAFVPVFRPLYATLAEKLSGRMKEVREREVARAKLDLWVRDFWEVLKRRAHRLQHPAELLTLFGLDSDGSIPALSTFDELVAAADKIVSGDAKAVAQGYPAMANPSVAEIAPILADARTQAADVPGADRDYTEAQQAIAAQRPQADGLIDDVMADLTSSLRKYDKPTQRRIMRGYGATFVPLPGEPAEPTDPTTPAATTTEGTAPGGTATGGTATPA